jgi:hypothetical protein
MALQHLKLHPLTGNSDHDTTGLANGQIVYVQNPTNGVQSTGMYADGSGGLTATTASITTLSAGTMISGSTNLYNIFLTAGQLSGTTVTAGSNVSVTTSGTNYTVSVVPSPSFNNLTFSGTATGGNVFGTNVSGGTLYSGNTNLESIFTQGSGTVGTVPLWNGPKFLGNSVITQSGTGVTVNGSIYIYGNVDVLGTASTFNTQTVQTADNNITMNLSGSHVSAFGGGITVLSGTPSNAPSTWTIDANGSWSSNTTILTSAITVNGGAMISGSTNLYQIFAPFGSGVQSVGANGNLSTGGTATNPTIVLAASPSFNSVTASGSSTFTGGLSASTLSGGTILSGSTNLYSIFTTGLHTNVQPGTNITTGGTAQAPIISTVASPSFNSITASGSSTFTGGLSASTLSGGTILSGSTNLYSIFTTGLHTNVQPGTNITTGGTAQAPTVNLVASPSINNLTFSGTATGGNVFGTNVSGGTIFSGNTNLEAIFTQGSGTVGTVPLWNGPKFLGNSVITQSGTGVTVNGSIYIYGNVDVLGTATTFNTQTIQTADNNITLNLSGSHVSAFGGGITVLSGTPSNVSSTWTIDANGAWSANTAILTSAITVNGGAIISGSTNLYQIFAPFGSGVQSVGANGNLSTGGTATNPTIILAASPSFNSITASGASSFTTLSATTLISGSTNIGNLFVNDVTAGSNISVGGSANHPTVNVVASPSFNNLTFSGTATGNALSATTLSGGTILSGSTNLYSIFATTGQDFTTASNGLTKSNYNVTLGGSLTANTVVDLNGNTIQISGQGGSSSTVAWSGAPYYTRLLVNGSGSQLKTTYGSVGNNFFLASDTMTMNYTDGGSGNQMIMKFDGTNMFVTDSVNSRGLEYVADYSPNFLSNSLVTKLYVSQAITGVTSGLTNTHVQPGTNTYTGGTAANPTVNVSALTVNTITASGNTSLQGTTGTTIYASQFFAMTPYTGANPAVTTNDQLWMYSAATGIITLNYKVGGVVKSVELS